MGWLSGYSKRKKITITGGASGAQTDFQIKLTVTYDGDMQSDFDDLRFTQADGETLIDAWLETKSDGSSADVWAEFPTTPANGVTQDYWMYYGNAAAASVWDCGHTFVLGDDFLGSSLDAVPTSGDVTIAGDAGKYEAWSGIAKNAAGDLFVVYRTCNTNTHSYESSGKIVIKKSTDNGQTWGSEVVVANEASPIDDRNAGILIFDDAGTETILVVYNTDNSTAADSRACCRKSINNGVSWGNKIQLSAGNERYTWNPPILLSNGKILVPIYVVNGLNTYVVESDDGGDTWTEYTVSSVYGSEFSIIETKTAGSYAGGVYGLIRDDTSPHVFKKVTSTNYGHTWSAASDEPDFDDPYPTPITFHRAPNGELLATYSTYATDLLEIYESTDEGTNWNHKITVVSGASVSYYSTIETINSSKLIVTWCTNAATSDVYVNFLDYPLLGHRWIVDSGAVTVANSEVTLDDTDVIRNPVKQSLPLEWRTKVNFANTTDYMIFGMAEEPVDEWCTSPDQDSFHLQALITGKDYPTSCNDGVLTQNTTHEGTAGDHIYGVKWKSGELKWYYDDVLIDTFTTNIPNEAIWAKFDHRTGTHKVDWIMIAKYVDNPPTYAFGSEESEAIELSAIIATVTAVSASDLNILRPLASTIAATTVTSQAEIDVLRELTSTIPAATLTSSILLKLILDLTSTIDTTTTTSVSALDVLRELDTTIASQTSLSDIELLLMGLVELSTTIATTASTSVADLEVLRELTASIGVQTAIEVTLDVLRELTASIDTTAAPSDIELLIVWLRELTATIATVTSTTTIPLSVLRELDSSIPTTTSLSSATLDILREFSSTVSAETSTSDVSMVILRSLASQIATGTDVSTATILVLRELSTTVPAETLTNAITLVLAMGRALRGTPTIKAQGNDPFIE